MHCNNIVTASCAIRYNAGTHARRPLRPWEPQQRQHRSDALQHQQQQDEKLLQQRQSLLQQALAAVCAALQHAAAPTAAETASPAAHAVLPVLAPAVAFLATAVPAVSGAYAVYVKTAAAAGACRCKQLAAAFLHLKQTYSQSCPLHRICM
jgi:hypothetical protein